MRAENAAAASATPCRMLSPVIEEIGDKYKAYFETVKVNVDENPELTECYGVSGIPALLLFKDVSYGHGCSCGLHQMEDGFRVLHRIQFHLHETALSIRLSYAMER